MCLSVQQGATGLTRLAANGPPKLPLACCLYCGEGSVGSCEASSSVRPPNGSLDGRFGARRTRWRVRAPRVLSFLGVPGCQNGGHGSTVAAGLAAAVWLAKSFVSYQPVRGNYLHTHPEQLASLPWNARYLRGQARQLLLCLTLYDLANDESRGTVVDSMIVNRSSTMPSTTSSTKSRDGLDRRRSGCVCLGFSKRVQMTECVERVGYLSTLLSI